jgi:hypothetical protein
MMQYLQSEWRRETEQQPIRLKTNLKTALKKLPLQWVKAMCAEAGLPVFPRASERVQALAEHLSDEKTLKAVWAKLPEASRRMAAWLVLDKQGGAAISALTEKFGPDADRSWYWDEGELPATPLGLLRLHGLVFVGATRIGQTREKVAVVPVELRPELRKCAAASDAFSDAPPLPPQPEQVSSSVEDSEIKEYLQQVLLNGPDASLTEMTELEHFLERYPLTKATEWLYSMVIENVISRPREFHPDAIRALVERMIEAGGTESRLLAYQLGADVFGPAFAEPATDEKSAKIRKWAQKRLGRSDDKTPR